MQLVDDWVSGRCSFEGGSALWRAVGAVSQSVPDPHAM